MRGRRLDVEVGEQHNRRLDVLWQLVLAAQTLECLPNVGLKRGEQLLATCDRRHAEIHAAHLKTKLCSRTQNALVILARAHHVMRGTSQLRLIGAEREIFAAEALCCGDRDAGRFVNYAGCKYDECGAKSVDRLRQTHREARC